MHEKPHPSVKFARKFGRKLRSKRKGRPKPPFCSFCAGFYGGQPPDCAVCRPSRLNFAFCSSLSVA